MAAAVILLFAVGYFIPTIIAFSRKHKDAPAICAINIFFGWSVIGWIMALIWSLADPRGRGATTVVVNTTQTVSTGGPNLSYPSVPAKSQQPKLQDNVKELSSADSDPRFWDSLPDERDRGGNNEYLGRFPAGESANPTDGALSGVKELELTGLGGFRENYLKIDQPELARMNRGLLVGRDSEGSDFYVEDESISRRHARLSVDGDGFLVEDLGSTNGTRVNGRDLRPHEPTPLRTGDRLGIGSANFDVTVTRS